MNEIVQDLKIKRRNKKLEQISKSTDTLTCLYINKDGLPDTAIDMSAEDIKYTIEVAKKYNLKIVALKGINSYEYSHDAPNGLDIMSLGKEQELEMITYDQAQELTEDDMVVAYIDEAQYSCCSFECLKDLLIQKKEMWNNIEDLPPGCVYFPATGDEYLEFDTKFMGKDEYIIALIE